MKYINPRSIFKWNQSNFIPINLNQFYLQNKDKITDTKNPAQINDLLRSLPYDTIGGYGEDRKDIWRGTYLDKTQQYVHLGVDINTVRHTLVYAPLTATVIDVFHDKDTKIGWGGRIILQSGKNAPYVIMAHLNPDTITVKVGDFINEGYYIGQIGTYPSNGNTFEHLHLQLRLTDDFDTMDGYGSYTDLVNNPCPFTTEV